MKNEVEIGVTIEQAHQEVRVLKRRLGRSLRECRQEMGITTVELSVALAVDPQVIRKAESGAPSVSIDLLLTSLIGIGLPTADIARLILEAE